MEIDGSACFSRLELSAGMIQPLSLSATESRHLPLHGRRNDRIVIGCGVYMTHCGNSNTALSTKLESLSPVVWASRSWFPVSVMQGTPLDLTYNCNLSD